MRTLLTIVVALILAGGAIASVALRNYDIFGRAINVALFAGFDVLGIVTLVFILAERFPGETPLERFGVGTWDPRALPPTDVRPVPRFNSLMEFLANAVALMVLLDVGSARSALLAILLGPFAAATSLQLTVAWQPLYIALVIGSATIAAISLLVFVKPFWRTPYEFVRMLANCGVIAGTALTMRAGPLITSAADPALATSVNTIALWVLAAAIAILALAVALAVRALYPQVSGRGLRAHLA